MKMGHVRRWGPWVEMRFVEHPIMWLFGGVRWRRERQLDLSASCLRTAGHPLSEDFWFATAVYFFTPKQRVLVQLLEGAGQESDDASGQFYKMFQWFS